MINPQDAEAAAHRRALVDFRQQVEKQKARADQGRAAAFGRADSGAPLFVDPKQGRDLERLLEFILQHAPRVVVLGANHLQARELKQRLEEVNNKIFERRVSRAGPRALLLMSDGMDGKGPLLLPLQLAPGCQNVQSGWNSGAVVPPPCCAWRSILFLERGGVSEAVGGASLSNPLLVSFFFGEEATPRLPSQVPPAGPRVDRQLGQSHL